MNIQKINILEGPWSKSKFQLISSKLGKHKIPIVTQSILPITRLYDNDYWWNLRSNHRITLAVPDFRHWLFDDDVFQKYIGRIASVNFPMLALFECPFGFEMPSRITFDVYIHKVFERISQLASVVKEKNKNTILLSPGISVIKEEYQQAFIDMFVHNRQYFDGYAVHCCNDMTDHALGRLSSLLVQIMKILPRPIWVTKWAVPCLDDKIINPQVIGPAGWQPYASATAIARLKHSFQLIESVSQSGSHWFYTGVGQDIYKPRKTPGSHEFWQSSMVALTPDEYSYGWQYWHFLGMITSDNKIKTHLLNHLIHMCKQYNE